MQTMQFTLVPVRDLPFPHGLGKGEYPGLEKAMKALLGDDWSVPSANQAAFWTPAYQQAITTHLRPIFDTRGDIVEIAREAASIASTSPLLDQVLPRSDGWQRYAATLPDRQDFSTPTLASWTLWPPRLELNRPHDPVTAAGLGDGRHRLSLLRSLIEPQGPEFPVLVQIYR
ncbi:MAG: hypothetical protein WDA07_01805 [Leucobacter sp.]